MTSNRLVAAAVGLISTALVIRNLMTLGTDGERGLLALIVIPLGVLAAFCWWFFLRGNDPATRELMRSGATGAVAVGAAAFFAGFVGPMIFTPEANQGPLLGILVTGPLGAVAGFLGGIAIALHRRRTSST